MKRRLVAAAAALAALAACTSTTAPAVGSGFAEPSAVAFFLGVDPSSSALRPYFAVANSAGNDLTIFNGVNDTAIPAREPLHGLVYPVAGRPLLLASADLGDLSLIHI